MTKSLETVSRGTGPAVALIHGWGLSAGVWEETAADLARDFRVDCVDLPGHGRAAREGRLGDLDTLADRLAATLPPQGAALVGWSLGGLVALQTAVRHPDRVRRVVLVAATPRFVQAPDWPHAMRRPVLDAFAQGLARDFRATLNRFLALQFHGVEGAPAAVRALRARLAAAPPAPAALEEGLALLRESDLRAALAGLACPVHALLGGYDTLVPAAVGAELKVLRPGMDVRVMPRAGHAPFLSHGERFASELRSLLHD
ncbi:pimeloyl-ACP methyl ester esterase BioH [Ectothiorhodospira mobilis]|uniref:pimeloyl-ACP methyl ester esterase BioH n=1 Tax=Ectothiorhodospira mobilis TaxID=195064 RepID=UPI001EE8DDCB|nr:pimeloyl-ACP methyl ester esterase BioH [Ectothiorhodospira mobilis]